MLPQKKYYRQRAHSNPISDHCFDYPISPEYINWNEYFSDGRSNAPVDFLDIGCGYGGLLVELSPSYPNKRILGLEIRVKVSDYVKDRIIALRSKSQIQDGRQTKNPHQNKLSQDPHDGQTQNSDPHQDKNQDQDKNQEEEKDKEESRTSGIQDGGVSYGNIACLRTNAMKYLPNYISKGQIEKMFFLFPDPHFKRTKHKWRIISQQLLAEYAYIMKVGTGAKNKEEQKDPPGRVYIATDVDDLFTWMTHHFDTFPLFERLSKDEMAQDAICGFLFESTEEGKKVTRMNGQKFMAVYQRVPDPVSQ